MFRVYDNKEKKWVKKDIYLAPNNDLFQSQKKLFGIEKLSLIPETRYIHQIDIGLYDENRKLMFEGDILKNESEGVIGVIAYSTSQAAYLLFDYKNSKYYPLGEIICKQCKVVGNVLENYDLLEQNEEDKEETKTTSDNK